MPAVHGLNVEFPHNPYMGQLNLMDKVIKGIKGGQNCVLESPTGTGKTLSLLCSSLAVQKSQIQNVFKTNSPQLQEHDTGTLIFQVDEFVRRCQSSTNIPTEVPWLSKVVFTTRTHSQIKQAMAELRSTEYKTMKSSVLGSRNQLCVNEQVRTAGGSADIHPNCRSSIKSENCTFFKGFEELQSDETFINDELSGKVLDIEDLVSLGKAKHFCPYYMSQHMAETADVVFSPYNYILDEKTRSRSTTIVVLESTVIFDEGHNIPQFCEGIASIEFDMDDILRILDDVERVIALMHLPNVRPEFQLSSVNSLKGFVQQFQTALDEIVILNPLCGVGHNGDFIFTLMEKANIGFHEATNSIILIDKIIVFLADIHRLWQCGAGLRKFQEILWIPFSDNGDPFVKDVKEHYRFYAELKKDEHSNVIEPHVKKYHFWCFSAKFVLEKLIKQMKPRSLIFTSGTMSPIGPFIESLCIPIEITLQCNHIVEQSQVLLEIISVGSDGKTTLDSSYKNRFKPEYIRSLGQTILNLCNVIPDGVLIFFTSYKVLDLCKDSWQASGIWTQIHNIKPIVIEPKTKAEYLVAIEKYYADVADPRTKGAIFIGVLRGKVAEGLDFADANGRAVIITGIPYPPWKEPKVQMKMKYLNDIRGKTNGAEWYDLEATRAVNQAVGRVIRHRNDYGAILLLDCRFRPHSGWPGWLQPHVNRGNPFKKFGATSATIAQFFEQNKVRRNAGNQELDVPEGTPDIPTMSAIERNLMYENEL